MHNNTFIRALFNADLSAVYELLESLQTESRRAFVNAALTIGGTDNLGLTPLHIACRVHADLRERHRPCQQARGIIAALLAAGADVSLRDVCGKIPAYYAQGMLTAEMRIAMLKAVDTGKPTNPFYSATDANAEGGKARMFVKRRAALYSEIDDDLPAAA